MKIDPSQSPIQSLILVYGQDARELSDDTLFGHIATIEAEISRLDAIKHKPQKLTARIDLMNKNIQALVELIDNRDENGNLLPAKAKAVNVNVGGKGDSKAK